MNHTLYLWLIYSKFYDAWQRIDSPYRTEEQMAAYAARAVLDVDSYCKVPGSEIVIAEKDIIHAVR